MKRAVIIGGGIGGLAAAVTLAAGGYSVSIVEQQQQLGGKLQRIKLGSYSFDRGPSTMTMKASFAAVFAAASRRMEDYVSFDLLEEGTRNVFADGSIVDVNGDLDAMTAQIAAYSPEDALALPSFMRESAKLYQLADKHFMNRLLLSWRDKLDPRLGAALLRVRPLVTLERLLKRYFRHPNTLSLFGRYATYVGSDPRQAPAIFAMLPHVEMMLGVYSIRGGTYALVDGLRRLAEELGVEIHLGEKVERIAVSGGRAIGVETEKRYLAADVVVANGDVLTVSRELLEPRHRPASMRSDAALSRFEPSLSGFVLLAGSRTTYDSLRHHTVFYPPCYGSEFDDIFQSRIAPAHPAIYVCWSGSSEGGLAPPGGSNLFILANAPYVSQKWSWDEMSESYAGRILSQLEEKGLNGLASDIEQFQAYTPEQLMLDTSAYRGAIYGISSNTARQTFSRPSNVGPVGDLWFTGGTTHPGGGTPMVALSGRLVAEAILSQR